MSKFRRWLPSILCLLAIWAGVMLVTRLVIAAKPTAGATLGHLKTKPDSTVSGESRQSWLDAVSSSLMRLDLDSRHLVLLDPAFRAVFAGLSAPEQTRFLEAIELRGMREFREGSKRWSLGRYERLSAPAMADLENLKTGSAGLTEAALVRPNRNAVAQAGIEAFLGSADPVTRFDLLPWVERMQKYSQQGR